MQSNIPEPTAVIGTACRFPGASSPARLWELLKNPKDLLQDIPTTRFNTAGFYRSNGAHHGATNVTKSYLLDEDHRTFDASFFNISPREAEAMDPQQRHLLEVIHETTESAGYPLGALAGSDTSVFVGVMGGDYHELQLRNVGSLPQHLATGTARSILSNRISYFFDWRGPSMTIDTACSSSLVAVHQAISSLQQGSKIAIVAGANLLLGPEAYIFESKLRMLSPTGRSRMWDASADGYARGEGFAAVMLKPLSKALQDGDTIECVIRASGVNQDGNSSAGLTAPTAEAQIALIQKTYAAAGLDPRNPRDRCQYFEAHGTGTPTGDPIEAEAISRAFFSSGEVVPTDQRLHVGSIKTIIGHLEGTAGLAGLIKASSMVQNGIIPPNLLFKTLNPKISPFYNNLRVPTVATKLPDPERGSPRRVSVNSFGFGGTNAHVIVENFSQERHEMMQDAVESSSRFVSPLPLVLSAKSDSSLRNQVVAMRDYLKQHLDVSLMDLAWTSIFHRTLFPYRVTFAAGTTEELLESLSAKAAGMEGAASSLQPVTSVGDAQPRILGVFTGQGAQWPQMGLYLYTHCPSFTAKIRELDQVLADLPDAPAWTLEDALKQNGETSQIHTAVISQPICTAVQVALVDLCRSVGLVFSTVIGHSSGEIAAAYAANIINAREAICIAYYRGFHGHLAAGVEQENGGMMATGLTLSQGKVFCAQDQWAGRLVVAAENGPGSTTLSGDEDAIVEAADALKRENIFFRVLRVEKAYHSHHMRPCAGPYLESLRTCMIRPRDPACTWISTVHVAEVSREGFLQTMDGRYWVENMARPVLFRQGLELALRAEASLDFALEIGPHPALSGPSKQTMKGVLGHSIPYHGTLSRGSNDSEAMSSMLGFVIANSSSLPRNLRQYPDLFQGIPRPSYLRNFPTYSWDHSTVFWKESRTSQRFRSRDTGIHDLLGSRMPDDNKDAMRWSNLLRANELPWTSGHRFQNQILFPAAGYILMAVEAALSLAQGAQVESVTLYDLQILKAITLEEASSGVETVFSLTREAGREDTSGLVHARFTLYATTQQDSSEMVKHFSGSVTVTLTTSVGGSFPQRDKSPEYLLDVDVEQFYKAMSRVGLDYTGTFRGVTSMRRKSRRAQTEVMHVGHAEGATDMAMHPGFVDACLQGLLGAYAAPNDGTFWTAYLPTAVRKAHFNLRSARPTDQGTSLVDSYITRASAQDLEGDVEVFDAQGGMRFELEGVVCTAIEHPSPMNDRRLFAKVAWKCDCPSPMEVQPSPSKDVAYIRQLSAICERYSYMYLKRLRSQIRKEEEASLKWHLRQLLAFTDFTLPRLEQGRCPTYDPKWVDDTEDVLDALASPFVDEVDVQIIRAVGSNLVEFFRETKMPLEVLQQNDMLTRQYIEGLGFNECNVHVGRIASQIVHRYPNMRILEIGAGTGATTRAMSGAMGDHYDEYFYTDVSAGFFERSKHILNSEKATYKILNVEEDPIPQGFEPHSFDLIVASNVLHATRVLKTTLENVRKLLRPGGYLLLMEITGEWLRNRLPISCLPGWWLGADDGRPHGATVTEGEWNNLLLRTGFSGIDRVERDAVDGMPHSMSTILSQGINETVETIREPLAFPGSVPPVGRLVILGGSSPRTFKIAREIKQHLQPWQPQIVIEPSPEHLENIKSDGPFSVLSIADFDDPLFYNPTSRRLAGLKKLLQNARHILWALENSHEDSPAANMSLGIARTLRTELPALSFQVLHLESETLDFSTLNTARCLAEYMLRLVLSKSESLDDSVLYSREPEVMIKKDKLWIPRVVPAVELNDRLNAARRAVSHKVDLEQHRIIPDELTISHKLPFASLGRVDDLIVPDAHVKVWMKSCSLYPVRVDADTFLYACVAHTTSGETVFALSQSNASVAVVPSELIVPCSSDHVDSALLLQRFVCGLISHTILGACFQSSVSLVFEPDKTLEAVLRYFAGQVGRAVRFVKSDVDAQIHDDSIRVRPLMTRRQICALLPRDARFVFNVHGDEESFGAIFDSIAPPAVRYGSSWIYGKAAHICPRYSPVAINATLTAICSLLERSGGLGQPYPTSSKPQSADDTSSPAVRVIHPHEPIVDNVHKSSMDTIVSYEVAKTALVRVNPAQDVLSFKADRTYLLVGLTGEIGRSLVTWMIDRGARYIALTSRSPDIPVEWLAETRASGATVKVFSTDVADIDAVQGLVTTIRKTLPPIAGVVNGAMVLSDQTIADMDVNEFAKVTQPKVSGSDCLDQVFFTDKSLDFFVLLSSLASVIGNYGQGNYNAANTYMVSLAKSRRQRGLAASVIHIGMVMGLGYLSRNPKFISRFERMNFMPISESDLHTMFAESIEMGRSAATEDVELIVGLSGSQRLSKSSTSSEGSSEQPSWFMDPRFSHLLENSRSHTAHTVSKPSEDSITAQLSTATDQQSMQVIVQNAISKQLALQLQMRPGSIYPESSLTSLGVDSLIAVDFRMWLLTQLGADVPVFKLLNGITIAQMSNDISQQLTSELDSRALEKDRSEPLQSVEQASTTESSTKSSALSSVSTDNKSDLEGSDIEIPDTTLTTPDIPPQTGEKESSAIMGTTEDRTDLERSDMKIPDTALTTPGTPPQTEEKESSAIVREGPLSEGQASLLFGQKFSNSDCMSNICIQFLLRGKLDISRFETALRSVIQRHEILRTAFLWNPESNGYVQAVLERSPFRFRHRVGDSDVQAENSRLLTTPFNLEQGHTMDATVISKDLETHYVLIGYHHIVMDGVSLRIFTQELHNAYSGRSDAPPLVHQIDFAEREREDRITSSWTMALEYWIHEFDKPMEALPLLPMSRVPGRRSQRAYSTSTVSLALDADTAAQIRQTSRSLNITPFQFYLTALQVLLFRFTNAEDLCIGIVDANRSERVFAETIGYLINTLPIRFAIDGATPFSKLTELTRAKMYLAMANATIPFSNILQELKIPRASTHSPLFQVLVNYRLGALEQSKLGNCDLSEMKGDLPKTPYDFTALITEKAKGECLLEFDVQDYLYSGFDSQQLLRSYAHILKTFANASHTLAGECEVFSPAMVEESMRFSQIPAIVRDDSSGTLWRSVNTQIQAASEDIAIKDGYGTHMSYSSLGRRVHEIIAQMREANIEPLSPVGMLCEPSADAVCALLAIWAYPAICVPMDLSNPVPRLDAIIRECKPSGILFHGKSEDVVKKVDAGGATFIDVGFRTPGGEDDGEYRDRGYDYTIDPESLALILYTSGTTGRPKGVTLSHMNLVTCISGMQERLALGKEVVLQQSSLGFDLAIAQVAVALTGGGTLVISRREQRGDALELSRLLRSEDVTFTFCVPSEYSVLLRFGHADLQHCQNWRFAVSAGERFTTQLKGEFRKLNHGVELVNAYGPAETTIISHLTKIRYQEDEADEFMDTNTSDDTLHVGPPLPYYSTFIMDEAGRPVPLGFPGEVYIGGLGVSPGYHNMEEVNRQKFLENPYCNESMRRLYRSGDRGRMLEDGSLVPLGRIDGDQQIKLRGMRVDLESIESSVVTTSRGVIREAVVVQKGDPAFLACFVIFNGTEAPANSDHVCRNILMELPEPEYMRPTVVVPLSEFPRTTNGKVDRAAMKNMVIQRGQDRPDSAYDEDLTASECVLRTLWLQLLSHDELAPLRIFKSTDFFAVGGSSLLLVELQYSISNEFHVTIPLKDLFASSSLEAMARRISRESGESTAKNTTISIDWDSETAIEKEVMELKSSIQELTRTKMPGEGLRVVLSGAFGYLGNAILADLVTNPAISIVDCIATRRPSDARTYDVSSAPEHLSKIKIHAGDLSDSLLGLSETLFHELSGTADAIIHNGADVSFLKDYSSLRAVNLVSTKVLLRMATPRKIPMHYVSTTGLAQLFPETSSEDQSILTPVPASHLPPPTMGTPGYIASKYASERYLERACAQLGVPVYVYRPSNIVQGAASQNIGVERRYKDLLGAILSFSELVKKVPRFSNWSGNVDFINLQTVSGVISSRCVSSVQAMAGGLSIIHVCGDRKSPINRLADYLHEDGVSVEQVDIQEWIEVAEAAGLPRVMCTAILDFSGVPWAYKEVQRGENTW